jgi:uncharacterized protein (TIGR02594 family)
MTAYDLATRYAEAHIVEIPGAKNHPLIQWWLSLCAMGLHMPDETPWCSAFLNGIAWELRLPRSKSAAARSWLTVGVPIAIEEARPEYDVVIFKRGLGPQPGPDVLNAPGHVAFFGRLEGENVQVLGGNQTNRIGLAPYPATDVLGVRRLL